MSVPEGNVIEVNEICVRRSPPLWLWIAISRKVGHVIGLDLGDRSDEGVASLWRDVPLDYRGDSYFRRGKRPPVDTDGWGPTDVSSPRGTVGGHSVCAKGSGRTSRIEGFNNKARKPPRAVSLSRQRQSGLARRSCGVHAGIRDDIVERFMMLAERHNRDCIWGWESRRKTA